MRRPSATSCSSSRGTGQTVVDLAYGDDETALVAAARAAGCTVIDGREALVRQGAASFRLWTGLEPPLDDDARGDQALAQTASPAPAASSTPATTATVTVQSRPCAARLQARRRSGVASRCGRRRRSSTTRSGRDCRGSARTGAGARPSGRTSSRGRAPHVPRGRRAPPAAGTCGCDRDGDLPARGHREPAGHRGRDAPAADRAADAQRHRDVHARCAGARS